MEKILFTSIPKSGTHLLLRYFDITGFKHAGPFGGLVFDEKFYDFVQNLQAGEYSAWHYHWSENLASIIRNNGAKVVFLYRDPRARVCSNLHFIMKTPHHRLFNFFTKHLQTDRERIQRLIEGFSDEDYFTHIMKKHNSDELDTIHPCPSDHPLLVTGKGPLSKHRGGINNVYRLFTRWLDDPDVFSVRFEDIIGPKGGGDGQTQMRVLRELMQFTGVPAVGSLDAETIATQLFHTGATTFRRGSIDAWREDLTPELHDLFLQESRELLELWGYDASLSGYGSK